MDGGQAKRLRALAALKARTQLPPAQQEPPQQPSNGKLDANAASRDRGTSNATLGAADERAAADHDDELEGDEDAWAGDHDARDAAVFDPDIGQNFDNQLNADEQHWEEENFAQKLPPGWAKCPNSGTELAGLFPTKVRCPPPNSQTT